MVAFEVSPLFHDVVKAPNGINMELFQDSSFCMLLIPKAVIAFSAHMKMLP